MKLPRIILLLLVLGLIVMLSSCSAPKKVCNTYSGANKSHHINIRR